VRAHEYMINHRSARSTGRLFAQSEHRMTMRGMVGLKCSIGGAYSIKVIILEISTAASSFPCFGGVISE
jgi:hypothetical protein